MFTFIALCFLSLWASQIHAQGNNVFKITAPKSGDTVTASKYTTDGVAVPIEWTVPDALADRPVMISLVQGNDLSSLKTIAQINSSAPNNGSYIWRGDSFDSALVFGYSHGVSSGCNYSIELKVWTDTIYSGYFTVISPNDGGLNTTSECPSGDAAIGPATQTYIGTSNGQASNDDSNPVSSTSTGSSSSTSSSSDTNNSSSGVSTTTLAVAVAVPIVVLLLIFGCIIWLGKRKGWFMKRSPRDGSSVEKTAVLVQHGGGGGGGGKPTGGGGEVRELHADGLPYQLHHEPIHELQSGDGDGDGGRGYVVRN